MQQYFFSTSIARFFDYGDEQQHEEEDAFWRKVQKRDKDGEEDCSQYAWKK